MNHEWTSFFLRTSVYAEHFKEFDFFPLWASIDNYGLGSPQPALYHRLFYFISGAIALVLGAGHPKETMVVAIVTWLVIGAFGIYRLVRSHGCSHIAAITAGVMLICANYTTTNWLVRGAMAEFSAAMLIPWILLALSKSVRTGRLGVDISLFIGLTFLAHTVLAFFAAIIATVTFLILLAARRLHPSVLNVKPLLVSALILIAMIGPDIFAIAQMGAGYDISRLISSPYYLPENQIKTISDYFFFGGYGWDKDWSSYSVTLDQAVLVGLLMATAILLFRRYREPTMPMVKNTTLFLIVVLCICALLQTRIAIPFYRHFPGASFIQFPWRLLAIITPVLITLLATTLSAAAPSRAGLLMMAVAAAMLVSNGAEKPINKWRSIDNLDYQSVSFSGLKEYVPLSADNYRESVRQEVGAQIEARGCSIENSSGVDKETARSYLVQCGSPTIIPLPEVSSAADTVTINGGSPQRCASESGFSDLCAAKVKRGESMITVHLPTMSSLIMETIMR